MIALIITIIVLLILAGITINQLLNNGLLQKANEAKEKVINAQEKENIILSDLEKEINNSNRGQYNDKEIKFYNGPQGFETVVGEIETNSYGLTYKTFELENQSSGTYYISRCEKIENVKLDTNFEISAQIYFNNETTYNMGSVNIEFLENDKSKYCITLNDAWQNENSITTRALVGETNLYYYNRQPKTNASGRYAIIGDGNKIYFYWGTKLLNSIDYTEKFSYDKITIEFLKYDNNHEIPPSYVESLYIGEPLYYKSILQQKAE